MNKDFLQGGATASSQYEGGYDLDGKGLDTQDCRPYLKRTSDATTATRYSHKMLQMKQKNVRVLEIILLEKAVMDIIIQMKILLY